MAFSFSSPSPQFQNPQTQPQMFPPQGTPFPSFLQQPQQQQQQFQLQPQQQQQQQFQLQPQQQQQQQFQLQPQQQQQQQIQIQQQQPQQQQIYLFTVDKSPAAYGTKWADLHPDSQKFLLQIEERILEYKGDSQMLDQCSRLYDSSISSNSFELVTNHIIQELGGTSTAMEREKVSVKELMTEVKNMMWNAEIAIRSYMMLRPRFLHQNASTISNNAGSQSLGATGNSGPCNQPNTNSMAPLYDFYYGLPKRPSPFMQHAVSRFEKYLVECCQWIEELEQLVLMDTDKTASSSGSLLIQSLPNVMSNVHDFFIHVAAKVEGLHQYIESMKTAYLADQRRRGDANDPFLEADRRETAKQEAAARRIHPTLHLPANSAQPSTQVAGLLTSSSMPGSSVPQQSIVGTSGASSGSSGSSLFSTPTAPSSTPSLFSTPIVSTPASNLFGTPGFSPQSTPFGTSSTSLFGSSQTTSLFGSSPSLASTPAAGSSLFSTPTLPQGAATGSGSSFGAASKSSRPKSRTARR